jgi:3-phenylpropionate/cinnamic acid dioxygenase small subunit
MVDLLALCAFNAAYAQAIDSESLEQWPSFFSENCHYRITHVENQREGLAAGIVYADSRAMLEDRIAALREANIYERQSYRHIVGLPTLRPGEIGEVAAETAFLVVRTVRDGRMDLFAAGAYLDRMRDDADGRLRFAERIVVCDSSRFDTLVAIPL